eukprot:4866647-Prymnesium_polylepis.1
MAIAGQVAWPARRASAADGPGGRRAHTARTTHTTHPHSPPVGHMKHMNQGKVVCSPRWTPGPARGWAGAPPALQRGGGA